MRLEISSGVYFVQENTFVKKRYKQVAPKREHVLFWVSWGYHRTLLGKHNTEQNIIDLDLKGSVRLENTLYQYLVTVTTKNSGIRNSLYYTDIFICCFYLFIAFLVFLIFGQLDKDLWFILFLVNISFSFAN